MPHLRAQAVRGPAAHPPPRVGRGGAGPGASRSALRPGRRGPRAVLALSAVIFGLAHLMNLVFSPDTPVATLSQVVYTMLLGLLCGAIWLRTASLWAVALLHGIFNSGSTVGRMFDPAWSQHVLEPVAADTSPGSALFVILLCLPAGIIGLWLLRPQRLARDPLPLG